MRTIGEYVAHLEVTVSRPRLERYRPADRDDLETATDYLMNAALAAALLPSIATLEVALRNSIHHVFTARYGTDDWFWAALKKEDLLTINKTWTKLAEKHKRPPTSGKLVAQQTFGFWPRLFELRYHELW